MLCVQAYNDWMIDEWCGTVPGRFIPLIIIPLWDPTGGAREIERCAEKGATAFASRRTPNRSVFPRSMTPTVTGIR